LASEKYKNNFEVPLTVLRGAKQAEECGTLSSSTPKPVRTLDLAVAYAVEKFCCGNSVSIAKPEKNYY
jgi:hypothetical protein